MWHLTIWPRGGAMLKKNTSNNSNNNSKKAVKAGIGYTIGNVLIKGIGFLTLPLFSRLMSMQEFGVYNIFISYESFLYVIIGFAIHSSIRSANLEFRKQINEYTSSVSLIYIINLLVFTFIAIIFGDELSSLLDFSKTIIILLVFYSFGNAMLSLYNNRISLDYEYKKYLVVAFYNSISNVAISLLLMFTLLKDNRDIGRIVGTTITLFSISLFLIINLFKKAKPRYNKIYWKFAVKYSLPIIPHGISQVLLSQFDRIMIQKLVGNVEAGIYSLAGNVRLILMIIIDSAMNAWNTWFYEQMDKDAIKEIQHRSKQICGLFVVFTIGLMAISPEMIWILGGPNYDAGKYVAIPMILDAFILFLYNILVLGEYYTKKTGYIMTMTMIAALINAVTNYIFIKKYGFLAAAYTTLFSYFIYLILHTIISYRLLGFYILPVKWMTIFILLTVFSASIDLLFVSYTSLRWMICLIEVTPIAVWLLKNNPGVVKKLLKR